MQELFERLEYAKKAVRTMLDKDGCSVDMHGLTYWAGEVERAPEFYQNIGMEWLYRTIKQPERFKRIYKTIPLFLIKSFCDGIKYRFSKRV